MPAIVINAYNRPHALQRLLHSLARAHVPDGTRLIISIDHGGDPQVRRIAENFAWAHGPFEVIAHERKRGLIGHFLFCGGLTRTLGDIIYLEDDLYVSRAFYAFAAQSLEAYRHDSRVAGISLNRLHFNGYTRYPFEPIPDAADVFFLQVYWYQGQAYTPRMWEEFETWWHTPDREVRPEDGLHPALLPGPAWEDDFFPSAIKYLAQTGKFFVFPCQSLTTNFGDAGTHFEHGTRFFQVPLQHHRRDFRFQPLEAALAVYDPFFEILPDRLAAALPGYDFDVDLNGTKPPAARTRPWVLTTRPVTAAARGFALALRPPEMNVLEGLPGRGIALARPGDIRRGWLADLRFEQQRHAYHARGEIALRRWLLYWLAKKLTRP